MISQAVIEVVKAKFESLRPVLDERQRRLWAATEARALGHGGIHALHRATGLAETTIQAGLKDLLSLEDQSSSEDAPVVGPRIRRAGGGRKPLLESDPQIVQELEKLVEPYSRGDPTSPLRWTCKSTRKLAEQLSAQGHAISARKVAQLLHQMGYSLQSARKTREGESHPDRDRQFQHINAATLEYQSQGQPVISVDAKKKELVGNFKNGGREWSEAGKPTEVNVYDFVDKTKGRAIPYGVYDVTSNEGWVSVGCDHDTAEFAVETIGRWWKQMGKGSYPKARRLLVLSDGGGSNGTRNRLWKLMLQKLANETGLEITVGHYPPATSKWNKIEHRMFCHMSLNWRGQPLTSHEVIVSLIGSTTTKTGLRIQAQLDPGIYPTGQEVSDEQMGSLSITRNDFHPDWNYTISPAPGREKR